MANKDAMLEALLKKWSNQGDTVLDCFMGSGTTGKMAVLNNRNFRRIFRNRR